MAEINENQENKGNERKLRETGCVTNGFALAGLASMSKTMARLRQTVISVREHLISSHLFCKRNTFRIDFTPLPLYSKVLSHIFCVYLLYTSMRPHAMVYLCT